VSTKAGPTLFQERRFIGINIKRSLKQKKLKFNILWKKHLVAVETLQENPIPMYTTKTMKRHKRDPKWWKKVAHKRVYKLHQAGRNNREKKRILFSILKRIKEHSQNLSLIKSLFKRSN